MTGAPGSQPSDSGPIGDVLDGLDPELAEAVEGLPAGARGLGDIHAMREFIAGSVAFREPGEEDGVVREDREVAGRHGGPAVRARLYRPASGPAATTALVWCHGGGFVFGDLEVSDARCADLCVDLGVVLVSVDYRLAPEHPFPAAVEDAYAVTAWVAHHAGELGLTSDRPAVGGSSAGATLTAAVALMARDRGGPPLSLQVLWQPATDDRCETASSKRVTDPRVLHRQVQLEMWDHYLGTAGTRGPVSAYAAPARATSLEGLPPAVVAVAEHDPLRDEGRAYARRLQDAGVPTRLFEVAGAFHGFEELVPESAIARRAHRRLVDEVTAALTA